MFRNIQSRFTQRLQTIKNKNQKQTDLEKNIRSFLVQEFGPIGETLGFKVSQENKKIHIRLENKIAANEVVLRSNKLRDSIKKYDNKIEGIIID